MATETKRGALGVAFKRPTQTPFIGVFGGISWASANLMFDVADDDLEIDMLAEGAVRPLRSGEAERE